MDNNAKLSMQLSVKQIFLAGIAAGALGAIALGFILMVAGGMNPSSWFTGSARVPNPIGQQPSYPTEPDGGPGGVMGVVPTVGDQDHIRGEKNAKVTIVEYSDFECPFCSRFHPTLVQLMNEYKGQVRWVYRHFPLSSHPNAQKAAEASECAAEQGKFWELADKMFEKQAQGLTVAQVATYAQEAGVKDIKKFNDCVSSGKHAARVASDLAGGEAAGASGTPNSFVLGPNGEQELIPGALPYESVKQIVDSMLK